MPAASVGDATPKKIDPSTAKMRKNGRMNALIIFIPLVFFLKSLIKESGIAGTLSGYNFDINVIYSMYKKTSVIPGRRAVVNNFPTDIGSFDAKKVDKMVIFDDFSQL